MPQAARLNWSHCRAFNSSAGKLVTKGDGFGAVMAQVAAEQGDLFDTREVQPTRRWRAGNGVPAVRAGLC